jgi:copper-binding protein NosD
MRPALRSIGIFLLAFALPCAALSAQQDLWVNAEFGNNSTGAGTAGNPWQTVSHALSQVTQTGSTIHLIGTASVDYTRTNGESFPWNLQKDVSLVGEPGITNPRVVVDVENTGIRALEYDPNEAVSTSRIAEITFQNASTAIFGAPTQFGFPFKPTIELCIFQSISGSAMRFEPGAFVDCDPTVRDNEGDNTGGIVWFIILGAVVNGNIEDNVWTNLTTTGFYVTGNTASSGVLTIQRNTLSGYGWFSFIYVGQFLGTIKILDNIVVASNEDGIHIKDCPSWNAESEIRGNDVSNTVYGIRVAGTDNVTLVENFCHDNGIGITGGWTLSGNNVSNNGLTGINVDGTGSGFGPTVIGNTASNNGAHGIYTPITDARIIDNVVNQNGLDGIRVGNFFGSNGDDTLIRGNTILANSGSGILIDAQGVEVLGNNIGGNANAGVRDLRCEANKYSGNVIHDHANSAYGAVQFVATTVTVAPEFFHNTVANNAGPGFDSFLVLGGSTAYVANSIFFGNNGAGMDVVGLSAGEYIFCDVEDDPNPGAPWDNISIDPEFVGPPFDYHLQETSPCRDAGTNLSKAWDVDLDNEPRVLDGLHNGQAISDMGADERSEVSFTVSSAGGNYQQGTNITLQVTGPAGAPCSIYAAGDYFDDPYAPFPGIDHPFFGTILMNTSKMLNNNNPILSGFNLNASGNLTLTGPLPGGAAVGLHIVAQAAVGGASVGWGQLSPAASFVITP